MCNNPIKSFQLLGYTLSMNIFISHHATFSYFLLANTFPFMKYNEIHMYGCTRYPYTKNCCILDPRERVGKCNTV